MWAAVVVRRRGAVDSSSRRLLRSVLVRAQSSQVESSKEGPIGEDGRHEIWREGIYDHDNEPK